MADRSVWYFIGTGKGLKIKMLSILQYVILIIIAILAWEDWQHRTVSLLSLVVLAVLAISIAYCQKDYWSFVFNISFVSFQMLILTLVFSIKNGQITWVLGTLIGWGDIVFITISTIWMTSALFLISYLLGLIGTLLLVVLLVKDPKQEKFSIPLVSGLGIAQIVIASFLLVR